MSPVSLAKNSHKLFSDESAAHAVYYEKNFLMDKKPNAVTAIILTHRGPEKRKSNYIFISLTKSLLQISRRFDN